MKIAIIGATGNVGKRLVDESLSRGHSVTAIARDPGKLQASPGLTLVTGDAHQPETLAPLLAGQAVVVSTVGFLMVKSEALIAAVRRSGVKRYLVVGGAGSLEVSPGNLLVDSPHFPALYKEEAMAGKAFLQALRKVDDLGWTMLSPSALFSAGERSTKFRLGLDALLTSAEGKSWISYEDYAIAMLDEIEHPKHLKRRFTVGY